MTIEEAIKTLHLEEESTTELNNAIRLGIKALERFYRLRKAGNYVGMPMLKGETTEEENKGQKTRLKT